MNHPRDPYLLALLLLSAVALWEVGWDVLQRTRVPAKEDWAALVKTVESGWKDTDVVVAAQLWAEPLVRRALGAHMPLSKTGRSDLLGYGRAWTIAINEEPSSPQPGATRLEKHTFGSLALSLFDLGGERVAFDLVNQFDQARVSREDHACTLRQGAPAGGGLGRGPLRPAANWMCPGQREWIGRTTIEDLQYQPRRCIWQRAQPRGPTRVSFEGLPTAKRLRVYGGHYLRDERKLETPPVTLNVYVDGKLEGQMTHRDGDGWKGFELSLNQANREETHSIAVEVLSASGEQNFCWAAKALR